MRVVANARSLESGPVICCADQLDPLTPPIHTEEMESILLHETPLSRRYVRAC